MRRSKSGDILFMTGYAGLKGTCELVNEKKEELKKRFSGSFIKAAEKLYDENPDIADRIDEMKNMAAEIFEVGKDGIFAALWDFAAEVELGLEVDIKSIPVRQETIEITDFLDVNPYEISAEGSLLISADRDECRELSVFLREMGINTDTIGKFTGQNERVLRNGDQKRFLTPVSRIEDEKRLRESQKK